MHKILISRFGFAGAILLLGASVSVAFAQAGGGHHVPRCECESSHCNSSIVAQDCSCCYDGAEMVWQCKECDRSFDCLEPPDPYTMCIDSPS
ncbi:MAG: hypothetical protein R3B57_12945 [Phycisphaerales bacterium]